MDQLLFNSTQDERLYLPGHTHSFAISSTLSKITFGSKIYSSLNTTIPYNLWHH